MVAEQRILELILESRVYLLEEEEEDEEEEEEEEEEKEDEEQEEEEQEGGEVEEVEEERGDEDVEEEAGGVKDIPYRLLSLCPARSKLYPHCDAHSAPTHTLISCNPHPRYPLSLHCL